MTSPHLILLPGLDGTGDLFGPLLKIIPPHFSTQVIAYPTDEPLSYDQLLQLIVAQLGNTPNLVLIGESFSGPLALRLAILHPDRVRAVVLSASFIDPPIPRWLCRLALSFMFRVPLPAWAMRLFLVGRSASDELVRLVRNSIRKVRPAVLAARVRDIGKLDCAPALRSCQAPILHLAGIHDAIVRRSSVAAIQLLRPDVHFRSIAAPHTLLQAAPAEAWHEIEKFIKEFCDRVPAPAP